MADIFVSYASEDLERVKPLVVALEKTGWTVWWDKDLVAGPSYEDKIEQALDEARIVVVVWSNQSIKSQWVRTEAHEGLEREILVPILIDDVKPPLAFRISQTATMFDWPDQSGQLENVIAGITELIGKATKSSQEQVTQPEQLDIETGIAVLPFVNLSNDPDNEYFSDGISEQTLNALVKANRTNVIARTSSFSFKGKNQDIREIGRLLGVTHILEGSVQKVSNNVRISAQLIDAATGAHLWSETYDRELLDVFAIQDDIAEKITGEVEQTLGIASDRDPHKLTSLISCADMPYYRLDIRL